ncbi:MAG: GNAT family N-acetyltransferase [Armatimonadota bacterium]
MFSYPLAPDAELRLLEPRHAEEQYALIDGNREHLGRWLNWVDQTLTIEDTRQFVRRSLERCANVGDFDAGIWQGDTLAGVIGLFNVNHAPEIGYWLGEEFQGKGLMTIACRAVVQHAFSTLQLHRVQIGCASTNLQSAAVAKRLGFQYEGTLRQLGWTSDGMVGQDIYGLLREEWKAV